MSRGKKIFRDCDLAIWRNQVTKFQEMDAKATEYHNRAVELYNRKTKDWPLISFYYSAYKGMVNKIAGMTIDELEAFV